MLCRLILGNRKQLHPEKKNRSTFFCCEFLNGSDKAMSKIQTSTIARQRTTEKSYYTAQTTLVGKRKAERRKMKRKYKFLFDFFDCFFSVGCFVGNEYHFSKLFINTFFRHTKQVRNPKKLYYLYIKMSSFSLLCANIKMSEKHNFWAAPKPVSKIHSDFFLCACRRFQVHFSSSITILLVDFRSFGLVYDYVMLYYRWLFRVHFEANESRVFIFITTRMKKRERAKDCSFLRERANAQVNKSRIVWHTFVRNTLHLLHTALSMANTPQTAYIKFIFLPSDFSSPCIRRCCCFTGRYESFSKNDEPKKVHTRHASKNRDRESQLVAKSQRHWWW